ncbi:hypothetical protein [Mucilaginibacter gynuensis]
MKPNLLTLLFTLLFFTGAFAQDSTKSNNPIIYYDGQIGYAISKYSG